MNEKEVIDEYFEKKMCVSFDKFIENWNETKEWLEFYKKENQQLKEQLQQRESIIEEATNKLMQYKEDLKKYQEQDKINHQNISIGLIGVKIRAFKDILTKYKEDN